MEVKININIFNKEKKKEHKGKFKLKNFKGNKHRNFNSKKNIED